LYSVEAMQSLREDTSVNVLIAYDREGLNFPLSRISAFALLLISSEGKRITNGHTKHDQSLSEENKSSAKMRTYAGSHFQSGHRNSKELHPAALRFEYLKGVL